MSALCALPQRHFLLQRSIILSFCGVKTSQALLYLPVNMCCWYISWCCTLMLIFPPPFFFTNSEVHFVSILTVIRIYTEWFMFSLWTERFLVINAFLSLQRIWFSLDWLSANSSVQYPFQSPVGKLPKMLLTHTYTHIDHCRQRGKGVGGCDGKNFPQLSLLFANMRSPDHQAQQLMCAYVPIMISSHKNNTCGAEFLTQMMFWQYIYICPF